MLQTVPNSGIERLFGQLKRHNDREWFAKNKERYQQVIVEPALLFIGSFAPDLAKLSPFFVADPRPTRGSLLKPPLSADAALEAGRRIFLWQATEGG